MSKLLVICGIPFAGKSTLAAVIAKHLDCVEVDVDDTKIQLYGPAITDEQLSPSDWVRIYDETDRAIATHLAAGRIVIDASRNFRRDERRRAKQVVDGVCGELVTVFVDTPESVARRRLLDNRQVRSRHDVTDSEFESILQAWEPPSQDESPLIVSHGINIVHWV
jgi:predicted kinase